MKYDSNFIQFCESDDQDDNLYYYLRSLIFRDKNDNFEFDSLYNSYIEKYSLTKNKEHYDLCKFYAFEYFFDTGLSEGYGFSDDKPKNYNFFYKKS